MLGGDERAFNELVERYSARSTGSRSARLSGDRELARETVQAAMTKAMARLETYRGDALAPDLAVRCCRNEILMHLRRLRAAPRQVELDDAAQPAAGSPSRHELDPETRLLRSESTRLVHMTLDLLPPRYAQALEWKYVDQLPVVEIAARLGVRTKAAESLLTRARNAFRAGYGDLLSTAAVAATSLPSTSELEELEVPDRE